MGKVKEKKKRYWKEKESHHIFERIGGKYDWKYRVTTSRCYSTATEMWEAKREKEYSAGKR